MALWIDGDMYPSYEALNEDTNENSVGAFAIDAFSDQPDFDGVAGRIAPIGMSVLTFTDAIDQSIGGEMTPQDQLGFSTGFVPMEVTRGSFNGQTIQPEQIDALYASQQYGDVGLSTRNETMVQGLKIQQNIFTPNETLSADSFVNPDFQDL